MPAPTETVVLTGDIVTMDPDRPRVQAVGVVDGVVTATGSVDDAKAACPAGTPELALPGTVTPGFIDSHVHMLWGGRDLERVNANAVTSVAELLGVVREYARANPDLPWIAGDASIDAETLAEGRFPTAAELDAAAEGRPVLLWRRSHDAFASTAALAAAGIGDDTPDPPGGVIERDAAGHATGFLVERPAAEMIDRCMPAPTLEDRLRWLESIQRRFLALGLTGVVDPALEADELLAFQAADERGALTVRTMAMPLGDGEIDPAERAASFAAAGVRLDNRDGASLRVGPWKLFLDGGGSLGTALLYEPWPAGDGSGVPAGGETYFGHQTTSTEGLRRWATWAAETGAGLGAHAVGSQAIDILLDAFEEASRIRPLHGLGFTLIHAYLWPSPEQMARCRDLGVLVQTQSLLQYSFGAGLIRRFGAQRIGRAHPMRSWLESGATVGGGSDGPGGASVAPLFAFWQMRTRAVEGYDGAVGIEEAVDTRQAMELYTTRAADVALFPELGRLKPGCAADLVALDVDPLAASPEECRDGGVLRTIVAGRVVHEA